MSSMYPPYVSNTSTRRCQRCGNPLAPSEVYCNTCGEYNSLTPASGPTERAQPPSGTSWGRPTPQTFYGGGQYGGQQWNQPPAPPAANNPYGGTSAPQQPAYLGNPYGTSQQPFYFALPAAPTKGFQSGSMNGYQPGSFMQPPPQKLGPKIGLIVTIIFLLVVLISGGFIGFLYITNHSDKTTTVTPTVVPSPTPSKPPLFSDSFQNNSNGWDLTSVSGKFSVKVGGGSMVLEDDDNKLLWELLPGNKTFSNFHLAVDAVLSKGDQTNGYGVYIRGGSNQSSDLATYYRFELYGDGTYAIFKGTIDTNGSSRSNKLVDYTSDSAIQKQGNLNHIVIIANGANMTFIVNGQTLKTITDNSYTGGSVALFVSNLPNTTPGAQATFSKLVIYPV